MAMMAKKVLKRSNKVLKKPKKVSKKSKIDPDDTKQDLVVKKKPSKVELKSVIAALKKDPTLVLVRKALKYVPQFLKSEGLTKKLLKEVIRLWAESSEKIRVICLLCLIRIYTKLKDKESRQMVIKKLYTTFLEKCRVTKNETMSMIGFMRHSLIELYKIDPQIAFKQAQTSCQQLSITLKNASTHKNEETYKTVLNWQFANCLILLSQLITSQDSDNPIKTLTQPIIQLNLDAINLLTSPRYYPFYCHLIENLIHLSIFANVFIPILPLMVSILKRIQIPQGKKGELPEDAKKYNIDLLNHVSLDEAHSLEFNLAILDKLYDLILIYLASQSHRIAFPELVFLPRVQIKKWLRRNSGKEAIKFKNLLDKTKTDCEKIEESRRSIDFAFNDYNAVDAWEKKMKDSGQLALPKLLAKSNVSDK